MAVSIRKTLCICMILGLNLFYGSNANSKLSGSLTKDAIAERLKPLGEVSIDNVSDQQSQTSKPHIEQGPPKIYKDNCQMCHHSGLAGAPKWGKKSDWEQRLTQGIEVITDKAYKGFKAMPPKGNCLKCSKEDIQATIEYMLDALE